MHVVLREPAGCGHAMNASNERLFECDRRFGDDRIMQAAEPRRVLNAERNKSVTTIYARTSLIVEQEVTSDTDAAGREQA